MRTPRPRSGPGGEFASTGGKCRTFGESEGEKLLVHRTGGMNTTRKMHQMSDTFDQHIAIGIAIGYRYSHRNQITCR